HMILLFFFFQAEDGIRDFHVTGVQTCALPISPASKVRANHGKSSPAISQERTVKDSIRTRKVAILAADGFDGPSLEALQQGLMDRGAKSEIISKNLGKLTSNSGSQVEVDKSYLTSASVMYDALFCVGGRKAV